jgi:hypothetical protein
MKFPEKISHDSPVAAETVYFGFWGPSGSCLLGAVPDQWSLLEFLHSPCPSYVLKDQRHCKVLLDSVRYFSV